MLLIAPVHQQAHKTVLFGLEYGRELAAGSQAGNRKDAPKSRARPYSPTGENTQSLWAAIVHCNGLTHMAEPAYARRP